jgi:hypothetical protein
LRACTPGYYSSEGRAEDDVVLYNEAFGGGPLAYWDMLAKFRDDGSLPGMVTVPFSQEAQEARL